ncbi:hypothetical protein [Streptomyces gobiensis]|uniref:hypothetical protein n=1 Tax=Streptomyces gobiensis TaxID=2875706 RepID=UPI001E3AEFC7|nr:hypothetical protein [Streptomyces gobiensis]UGY90772.1 hypothetical protein test1122_02875 [Streptomyces gobiensis]
MSVEAFNAYARDLTMLVSETAAGQWGRVADDVHHALNGQAAARLRALVARRDRRSSGSFFTAGVAREEFEGLLDKFPGTDSYWDPACGAGDLLLAAVERMPLGATPGETLTLWNRRLHGHELHAPFVEAARMRLVLALLARHRDVGSEGELSQRRLVSAFPRVRVGDGLQALALAGAARRFGGHLILNPPYGMAPALPDCTWSSGSTSLAATFTASALAAMRPGGRLTAVLPDVLRSGSRYAAWRDELASSLDLLAVQRHGQFDAHTDIDVFMLAGRRGARGHRGAVTWWDGRHRDDQQCIDNYFSVSVGPVVDNRDPHTGPRVPYLTARDLPGRGESGLPERSRQFPGKLVQPPFVVLRRTSRPGQGAKGGGRGAGVLIHGPSPVAVDNHLIVAVPRVGGLSKCHELLAVLEHPETGRWLDERIRCRHLTVTAVRSLPWH